MTQQQARFLLEEGDIEPRVLSSFYNGVRCFFEKAIEYGLQSLPLNDPLLKAATFVNFNQRESADSLQPEYFVSRYVLVYAYTSKMCYSSLSCIVYRFQHLLDFSSPLELSKLGEEFVDYQLLSDSDIPQSVWDAAKLASNDDDDEDKFYRIDVVWHYLSGLKLSDGTKRFKRLSQVAMLALTVPHSNAGEERVFSMVRKNKTPFRPSLGLEKTLPSLLTVKLATCEPCHKFEPDPAVVARAGKVTWEYNKQHMRSK